MKLQSFYYSNNGNAKAISEKIAREYKLKADQIPPAYQPEREAIVFIAFESGKLEPKLVNFCKSLTPAKTKNVAISIVGADTKGLDELKALVAATGVNVIDNVYTATVKGGLFSKGKISDEQVEAGLQWAHSVVAAVGME